MIDRHPLVEDILGTWTAALGADLAGYRGHVYRVLNLCRALAPSADDEQAAIATAFHDLGIWSDGTFDYLPPSVARATAFLDATGRAPATDAVARAIEMHHKLLPYHGDDALLVEALRRADLIDVSLGLVRFGVPREFVRQVRGAFPNCGFHATLARLIGRELVRRPWRPLPMMRL
ncbi:MAG TPA: phosphohydrolase [Candidatus Binatia bacterium]|nr:phosphohydrolase [Candidatus Binatia bacterium]